MTLVGFSEMTAVSEISQPFFVDQGIEMPCPFVILFQFDELISLYSQPSINGRNS